MLKANPAQEAAIKTISGPVILVSCPGSGKTTTLVRRIHHMIEKGVNPNTILMVTFTKDAADGMARKYEELYGNGCGATFATIHSLCFNILRTEKICGESDVISESAKHDVLFKAFKAKGYGKDAWEMASNAATALSNMKNNSLSISQLNVEGIPQDVLEGVLEGYMDWCQDNGWLDYDDMLIKCRDTLKNSPALLEKYQKIFRYIQCDEYQDTNYVQRDILYLLAGQSKNLCVVGDDDQSVYAFRGARPEIMLSFEKDFPGARIIYMGTNYRSASKIVDYAGNLIANNRVRFQKELKSERGEDGDEGKVYIKSHTSRTDEMESMTAEIKKYHANGMPYSDMAVLFRTNKQVQAPVLSFVTAGVPYYTTENAKSMYENFMFTDMMAYVHLSNGTGNDRHLLNIINKPNRFLKERVFKGCKFNLEDMIERIQYILDDGGAKWQYDRAVSSLETLFECFGPGEVTLKDSPQRMLYALNSSNGICYEKYVQEYAQYRNMNVGEIMDQYTALCQDAMRFATIGEWFDFANRFTKQLHDDLKRRNKDGVMLTTMHRSKGLEWKVVFIVDCDEGITPHVKSQDTKAELEEERRLFYVAMTRAKDILYMCHAGDKPSRFIAEALSSKPFVDEARRKIIPKKLPGTPVTHKTFGNGKVIKYEEDTIVCEFDMVGLKRIKFPETFQRDIMFYDSTH